MNAMRCGLLGLGLALAGLAPPSGAAQPDGANAVVAAQAYVDGGVAVTELTLAAGAAPGFAQALGSVDLHGLAPGVHTIWLRLQDQRGSWSQPLGQSFQLPESVAPDTGTANQVTAAELFVDTDPGEGAATPIPAPVDGAFGQPAESLLQTVNLNGLGAGSHTLYVRVRDGHGHWSPPLGQSVYLSPYDAAAPGPGGNRLLAAEVFFDTDPGPGHGRPLTGTADGGLGGLLEALRDSTYLAGLTPGVHTAYVRVRNGAGTWSRTLGQSLVVSAVQGPDSDGDGVPDSRDNCPTVPNPDQADLDGDGLGDACDSDIDGDGVPNGQDAFPRDPTEWHDNDHDGIGDNADPDDDNDGVLDGADNCPLIANPDQADSDGDTVGDACERRLYVDAAVSGGAGDGSDWANAFSSLGEALDSAQTGDDLWVAQGVYYPDRRHGLDSKDPADSFEVPSGIQVWGGFAGHETALGQRDWYWNRTVLSGDIGQDDANTDRNRTDEGAGQIVGSNSAHVVHTAAVDGHTVVDGFIITGGDAVLGNGGGWLNEGGAPVLGHLRFFGNRAELGGALYSDGSPRVTNSAFAGNAARQGGAVYLAGGNTGATNVSFGANSAVDPGGALFTQAGTLSLANAVLWGDTPGEVGTDAGATVTFAFSLVQGSGGAAWNGSAGIDGGNNLDADPGFLDPTRGDLQLGNAASAALNAGSNAAAQAAGLATSLNGSPRVQQGTVDMGAYEQTMAAGAAVTGSGGDDWIITQRSNTSVLAGTGGDTILSSLGRQVITLGAGRDLVVWGYYPDSDVINDFSLGEDRLDLRPVLLSLGYTGADPLGDGHVSCQSVAGGAYLLLDKDGPGGLAAGTYALVKGPGVTAATLCVPGNFNF